MADLKTLKKVRGTTRARVSRLIGRYKDVLQEKLWISNRKNNGYITKFERQVKWFKENK